jgi:hypothetical protein
LAVLKVDSLVVKLVSTMAAQKENWKVELMGQKLAGKLVV